MWFWIILIVVVAGLAALQLVTLTVVALVARWRVQREIERRKRR